MRTDISWFIRGVRFAKKYFFWLIKDNEKTQKKLKKYFPSEYEELLICSGLDIRPYDILLFAYTGAFLSFLFFFIFNLLIVFVSTLFSETIDIVTIMLMAIVLIVVPTVVLNLLANYPKTYARYLQIHCLGDIPELLSYLVMYLKLVPNLENSVKFAASESSTTLASD